MIFTLCLNAGTQRASLINEAQALIDEGLLMAESMAKLISQDKNMTSVDLRGRKIGCEGSTVCISGHTVLTQSVF